MEKSKLSEIKEFFNMKASRVFASITFIIISTTAILAQPVWNSGPTITPKPISFDLSFNLNRASYVYYFVMPGIYTPSPALTPNDVKVYSTVALPYGAIVGNDRITYSGGMVGNNYTHKIYGELADLTVNTTYTIYIVAEQISNGLFTAVSRIVSTTLDCPKIQLFTFFGNLGECVNTGAQGTYQVAPLGALPTGVLKNTTWTVDWGDGSAPYTYTSTADDNLPPAQTHNFSQTTDCAYVGTWTVSNHCGEFLAGQGVFVVHGRDIPTDGDGVLQMEEVTTHTPDIYQVCEGRQYNITLADISTWNCQNPNVPSPLNPADYDNDKPRTIQFVYGETPAGAVMNTITGNVLIAGTNIANPTNGYVGPVVTPINPPNPNTQTDVITIPATCKATERFYVYIKNWNKCNPYTGDPSVNYEYEDFIIEIIDAPNAPIVTTPKNYCFGSVPAQISATPNTPGNTIKWYSNSSLTAWLYTGQNYTHGKTAVGTYNYWVTETAVPGGCEGPAAQITMNIIALPNKPTINITGSTSFCYNGTTSVTLTANPNTPPSITSYQWYQNGNPFATGSSITLNQVAQSGSYTVRTYGLAPTNCPSPLSDPVVVSIDLPPTATVGPTQIICNSTTATLSGNTPTGGATGLWSFPSIWKEDFTGLADGTTSDAGPTSWSRTISNSGSGWYSEVRSQKYELRYNRTVWTSGTINISAFMNVGISVDFSSYATGNGFESPQDYIQARAIVDGTPTTFFNITGAVDGSTGAGSVALKTVKATASNINGNNLVIEITLYNSATDEYFQFDNVTVTVGNTPLITDPTNPTSTVTNLPVGNTTFTWTVSSAYNVCPPATASLLLTVNPQFPLAQLYSSHSVCSGATSTISVTMTGGTGPYDIVWNDGSAHTITNYVSGSNITIGPYASGTRNITLTSAVDDRGCPAISRGTPITITTGPTPTAATLTGSGNACLGATSSLRVTVTSGVPPYDLIINGTTYLDHISGNNINLGALGLGAHPYNLTSVIDDCGNAVPAGGLPGTYTITIYPVPDAGGTVNNTPVICNNGTTNIVLHSTVALTDFIWTASNSPAVTWQGGKAPTGGISVAGEGTLIAQNLAHNGTEPITVTYTITPRGPGATLCMGPAITRTVVVNPAGQVDQPGNQVVCNGNNIAAVNFATVNTGGTTTYTWTNSAPGIGLAANGSGNIAAFAAVNTGTSPVVATIVVTPTFTNGSVGCAGSTKTFTITVNPSGQVNQPGNQVVCNNTSTAAVTFTTDRSGGTTTYSWTNSAPGIGLAANGTGNIASFTATNSGTSPVVATIVVTPTFTNASVGCAGSTKTFTITVNPTGQVDQPGNQVVCNNTSTAAVTFTTDRSGGTTTYAWTNSAPGIGLAASGSGNIAAFTAVNNGTSPVVATIVVTPTFTNASVGCAGSTKTFTITVNPTGQVDQPGNQVVCNNTSTAAVTFTTDRSGGTTTYAWTNSAPGIGLAASGTGNIASFTAVNGSTAPVIATIVVTPTFTNASVGCAGSTKTFTITVNPTPTLSSSLTPPDVCSNTPFSYNPTSGTSGTTFNWTRALVAGITPAGPNSGTDNPNETLINITSAPIAVTYVYTLSANSCNNAQNVVVNIKPEPVISNQSASVCSGETMDYQILLDNFTNPGANATFTWLAPVLSGSLTGGSARPVASADNITDVFTNTSGIVETATYTITPYYNGCQGAPKTIVVSVGSQPVLDPNLNMGICSGSATGLILKVAPASVPATSYNVVSITPQGGLIPGGGNAVAQNGVTSTYLSNDVFTNETGVNKTVTYRVRPVFGTTCIGAPVDIVVTIWPQPVILTGQTKTICPAVPANKEIFLQPANTPAGTLFNWNAPVMSAGPGQGTAGVNVAADPAGTFHITDTFVNNTGAPITATYTVIPTSSLGCTGTSRDVIITINPRPAAPVITGRDKICINEKNIVYNVTPVPGSTFTWTVDPAIGTKTFDFNTNAIIIDAAAVPGSGNISVFEINAYTCPGDVETFPVQVYTQAAPENITGSTSVCANSTHIYSVTNRAGSVYTWNVPGGAAIIGDPSTSSITVVFGNVGGTIAVRETNIAGCITDHNQLPVTVIPLPTATISNGGTICEGGSRNLSVDFTGTGPYTFTHALNGVPQGPVNTSDDPYILNVTLAGTYTIVNVTDANCTNVGSGSATVTYFPKPVGIISGSKEHCRGNSATITMTFTGLAPFTFTYTDGTTPVTVIAHPTNVYTVTVSPLVTTTYTLTALSDGNSCVGVVSGSAVITVNIPPVLTLVGTNLTCYNDNTGAVALTVTGNSPYGYAWTGPDGWTANTEDISGLKAGLYSVTVTDTKGCVSTGSVTLTQPAILAATLASTNIFCFGSPEGTITISAPSGGSGTYEYTIDGGTTWVGSGSFTGLNPGTYNVKIRDAARPVCVITLDATKVLTGPAVLDADITKTDVTCNGVNNGSIVISNPTGGFGTYGYSINGGTTWQGSVNFPNLAPGTYDVRIRDAAHITCVVILDPAVVIAQPTILSATVNRTNITCFGSSDGTITISGAAGGHGTYEYSINGGGSWQASGSYSSLTPGTYNVQIRDAAYTSCYIILNNALVITQPPVLKATITTTMITCNGASDGIINITGPSGGYGTYEYTINGGTSWQASGLYNGLAPGSYDVRIRDAANAACEVALNNGVDITEPAALNALVMDTDITCFGANNGTITVTNPSGGYGTYEYSNTGGAAWQSSNTFTGLAPNTYDVRIRDKVQIACVKILTPAVISEPAILSATVNFTDVTCNGASDGTITISSPAGGYGTYSYSINGGASWQGSGSFTNLAPGIYNVRIRDAANITCVIVLDPALAINEPAILSATVTKTNVTCFGAADGTITISGAAGGYGTYEYSINGGATWQASSSFTGLIPDIYNVKIRDAANPGCIITLNGALSITQPAILNATAARTNVTCNGSTDGTITITNPTGGYGTYEYSINGGTTWQATGNYTALAAGSYDVRIRDAANIACVITLNPALVITEPAILAATVTPTMVTCFGANNGIITITGASGGYGTYEYSVNGGTTWSGFGNFTNLAPGTYDVRIRDAVNTACVITLNPALVITQPAVLSATVAKTDISCYGGTDGSITITNPLGGYGTYEYSINGGGSWQASGSFTSLAPGNYNVRIRDAARTSCVIVLNPALQITQPAVLNATVTPTMVTCNGGSDGIINITLPTGGFGTYEYSVNGGTSWQASGSFTALAPGSYDVRIRDAANTTCVIVLNPALMITEPAVMSANVASANVTCFGANNGTITITSPTGGYGTYEYSNNGGSTWQATGNFTSLAPGSYNVQIRDKAHITCVIVLNPALVITEPAVLSATVASTNVTCFGSTNGTITITNPLGGYGTYGYSVNGGTSWQATGSFTNLAPGSYDVRIRDAANTACVIVLNPALVITQPAVLSATVAKTNVTCFGSADGTITITNPLGGYGTYEYSNNGGSTWQASGSFTALAPGFYNVQIRDAANPACVIILNGALNITQPAVLNANIAKTNVTCNGSSDGTITITNPMGGYGTYEYSINGGSTWQATGSYTALAAGSYNVRLRDAANTACVIVLNPALVITEPAVLAATVTPTMVTCFGSSDGIITITGATGGYGSFEYTINGGTTWSGVGNFTNLAPGNYDVRIRDAANPLCIITLNAALAITQPAVLSATVSKTDISCYGGTDGTITITNPLGGYGTYEYSINGGGSWQASGSFTGLGPGNYNVRIRDAAHTSCVIVLNPVLTITQPAVINAAVTPTMVTCNGASDGIISITSPMGGSGTYDYSVNGGTSWQASGLFSGLAPGSYDVRIRDAANAACVIVLNPALVITEPAAMNATVASTNVMCFGANNGTITITSPTGGYGTYEYSNDGGATWQATGNFTNLAPGSYNVRIRDRAHITCVIVLNPALVITEPPVMGATVASTNVTCFGSTNGTITITNPLGGYGTYGYSVNGGTSWQATGSFTNLAPGSYDVRIRDAGNPSCVIILNPALLITQPAVPSATVAKTDITCFGAADGTITITNPLGGYGTYEYSINGGGSWQASGSYTALAPGFYNVQIRDAANPACVVILNGALNITQPAILNANIAKTNVTCNGSSDGTITITNPTGGYGTYEYSINGGGTWQASGSYTALAAGSYDVRIRDAANTACVIVLNPTLVITEPAILAAIVTPTHVTCFGASDGIITITGATGGYGSYEYTVNGGTTWSGVGNFTNLAPGNYDVRIRDAANPLCIVTLNATLAITQPAVLSATVNKTDISCYGGTDGTITITNPLGGYGTFEYSINGGGSWQASGNFTSLAPGNYNVRIRDAAHMSCVIVLNPALAITQPAVLNATVTPTMVTCNGAGDGIINITSPTGGFGTYEYSINGGTTWQVSGNYTALAPGSYDVRIRDAANTACVIVLNSALMITEPAVMNANVASTNVTCFGANNGTITITSPTGGYGTYEYSNNGGSTWQATGNFTGLTPGSYNVQIRDKAHITCVIMLNPALVITEPAILSATVASTNVTCFASANGTITITNPLGGYGTYGYSVNGGTSWQATGNFTNLAPGSYDVRIRDAANTACVIVLNPALVITEPAVLSATVAKTNVTCFGAADGTITITNPLGGYGTYEYTINGGTTWQASGSFTALAPGYYNVQIRDAANTGCVIILNWSLSITQPPVLNANVTKTNITCNGANDGTITISNPTGGYGTYEYSINGGGLWQASGSFTALAAGSYDVRIRDAANTACVIVLNPALVITEPPILTATVTPTDVTCFGASDGIITIAGATGGYGAYEYTINGGTTWSGLSNFTNLAPGTYDVRIRDAANTLCVITLNAALVITQPAVLSATVNKTDISCFGSTDGTITITNPLGGYGTYEYSINGGGSWQASGSFTNLAPGSYNVRIRDAAHTSCVIVLNNALQLTQPAVLNAAVTPTMVTCNGAGDGIINITGPSGGYGTYEYTINGGTSWQASGSFTALVPGSYDVRIRDAANTACVIVLNPSLMITEPAVMNANVASVNVTCFGANDGTITITSPTGGYGTYEYSNNGGSTWQATGNFTNLTPGSYNVQIRDKAHITCVIVLNPALVITEPVILSATVASTNVTCFGANNGTITITNPLGGYGTYAYSVNGGTTWQSSGNFINLAPGTYNVRIRDAANTACVIVLNPALVITQPAVLSATVASANVTCFGAADGTITITNPLGGYGTYEYTINGGTTWQASGGFTALAPGYYNVQIRDAANTGCVIILNGSLRITEPPVLAAFVSKTDVTCNGGSDGTITVNGATGGYGTYEYTVNGGTVWQASGSFAGLVPGSYNIQIRDAANTGCVIVLNPALVITQPAILAATVTPTMVNCFNANDGIITISGPSGGSGAYQYSINGGTTWQGLGIFNNLAPGTYDVRIRDAVNPLCIITLNPALVITQPAVLAANIASTNVTCFGGNDGTITISGQTGGYGTYEFSINGGGSWQASGNFTALTPGSYNIRIRDAAHIGCVIVLNSAYIITQPALLTATVAKTDVTCNGANDGIITLSAPAGGYGTYEYSINGGSTWQGSGNFTSLVPGTYDVRMRDAANTACSVILYPNLLITEPLILAMSSTGDILLDCFGDMDGMGTFYASGGTMPYTFSVTANTTGSSIAAPGFNSQTFFAAGAGSITVSVTDFNGCFAQATINITQPALLTSGSIEADQVLCSGDNPAELTESVAATGGPAPYNYQWQYAVNVAGPFMNIASATAYQYTPQAGATSTFYYRRMVTSGMCLPVYSNIIEVKVNPRPVAVLSGGETICPTQTSILKVNMAIGTGPFELDIENLGTVTGYVSGADIVVSPAATTTYRLLRVRDANNCEVVSPSANLMGQATVTVRILPTITAPPVDRTLCEFGMTTFNVTATGSDLTYQWYVNQSGTFNPVVDGGIYFGAQTPTLNLFGTTRLMNGYVYHVVVTTCSTPVTSADALLTVNTIPEIVSQPKDTIICMNDGAAFGVTATGTGLTYQWQVSQGSGFVNVVDNLNFSGSDQDTLFITNAPGTFNNNIFRVIVSGVCGVPVYSNFAVLTVNVPPTVTINPTNKAICENGGPVTFIGNGSGMIDSLRWQIYTGGIWTDIYDDAIYSGTTTQQLTLINVPVTYNGNQYRLGLKAFCLTVYTNSATLTVNANPIVDFSAVDPINACGGIPLVIDGNPSGGSGSWATHIWTGDIGPLSNYFIQSPTFNSMIPGPYVLNYKVKDSNGCFGHDTVTVVVDRPDASFTQNTNYGCTPVTINFIKNMTGIASFSWDFDDGSPANTVDANPVHIFTNSDPSSIEYHNVTLTVQSPSGCFDTFTTLITVYPAVDATFTASDIIVCSGGSLTFTATPGAGKYFWEYGDGGSGYSTATTNHVFTNFTTAPLPLTVRLTTTSFYNCTDVETMNITVMPVPLPGFNAIPPSQVFDPAGNLVTFPNTTNAGTWTWLWRFGDGATSTVETPSHTYTGLGDFVVTLVVSNANCSDSIQHTVRVAPIPPIADFDSVPSGCSPLYVVLNNTSTNDEAPGTTYLWDFGDGSYSTAENPTYTYFTAGTYRIELTVTGPGGVSTKSQVISAYPGPRAYFEVAPSFVFVNDERVRCFNLSQDADSYLWEFGDGDTSKLKEPFHRYIEEGVYDITLWAYSDNGCTDKYVLSPGVTVEPAGELRFATVFTPNKEGPIELDHLPTGGTEVDQFFYPPIREKVIPDTYKLQIFNRLGVLIFESHNINIPWNGYYKGKLCPQGVYVWYVEGKFANGKPFKKVGDITLLH